MKGLVLFDSDCGLCSRAVVFIIKRDKLKRFQFMPLESPAARQLLKSRGIGPNPDFLVLIEEREAHTASTAALKIIGRLPFPWRLFSILLLVPETLRNGIYNWAARRRRRWFGEPNCPLTDLEDYRSMLFPDPEKFAKPKTD